MAESEVTVRAPREEREEREGRIVRRIWLAGTLLVILLGAAWGGVSAYVWRMPVDSYTLVEHIKGDAGQITSHSITVHDAAQALALRNAINSNQTSLGLFGQPSCTGTLYWGPAGSYVITFFSGGAAIETVAGAMGDCQATIQCAWSLPVYVAGAAYMLPEP